MSTRNAGAARKPLLMALLAVGAHLSALAADTRSAPPPPSCAAPALAVDAPCTGVLGHRLEVDLLVAPDAPVRSPLPAVTPPEVAGLSREEAFARYCEALAEERIHRTVAGAEIVVDMRPPYPPRYLLRGDARKRLGVRSDQAARWLPALFAEDPWLLEDVLAVWNDEEGLAFSASIVNLAGMAAFEVPQRPLPSPPERPAGRPYPVALAEVPDDTLPDFLRKPALRLPHLPQETWARYSIAGGAAFLAPARRLGIRARYGFERRGLDLPGARALGIAGRTLRVIDLATGEVLAEQRALLRFPQDADAAGVEVCPATAGGADALARFLGRVLGGAGGRAGSGARGAGDTKPGSGASTDGQNTSPGAGDGP